MGLEDLLSNLPDPEETLRSLDKFESEQSLTNFVRLAWPVLEPGTNLVWGWSIDAICEHLEAVTRGEIKRLLINIPPGTAKSFLVNVIWPAWEWGPKNLPYMRYISTSYSHDLAIRDNGRCRELIKSEWYQERWGDRFQFKPAQDAKTRYENTAMGFRQTSSVGASLIGHRGDRIIIDDPHSPQTAESEADRTTALQWFSETIPTRLNNMSESAIIIIMQRLHANDISGLILEKELGYDHLCLPMEFESDHPFLSKTKLHFIDPRKEDGELLWPERFPRDTVEGLKESFRSWGGTYAEAGQLQQRPVAREGGMFNPENFILCADVPDRTVKVRGWDLAASKDSRAAWTVGALMAMDSDGKVYIEDVIRLRGTPKEVEDAIAEAIEKDGPGVEQSLPQDPGQAGKAQKAHIASKFHGALLHFSLETGSKEDRARPLAAQVESGNVFMVRASWNEDFTKEASLFPAGEFKDQIDACTRAYSRLVVAEPAPVVVAPTYLS